MVGMWVLVKYYLDFFIYQKKNPLKITYFPSSFPSSGGGSVLFLSQFPTVSRTTLFPLSTTRSQCSRPVFLLPNNLCLPTILAGPGSEPLILKIKKQNTVILCSQGALCLTLLWITSSAPMAWLRVPKESPGAWGGQSWLKALGWSGPRRHVAWCLREWRAPDLSVDVRASSVS